MRLQGSMSRSASVRGTTRSARSTAESRSPPNAVVEVVDAIGDIVVEDGPENESSSVTVVGPQRSALEEEALDIREASADGSIPLSPQDHTQERAQPEHEATGEPQLVSSQVVIEPSGTVPDIVTKGSMMPPKATDSLGENPISPPPETSPETSPTQVFGSLSITKDLDPRKAELLRQAQLRVLAKRKAQGVATPGASSLSGGPGSSAPAAAEASESPGKSSWQDKLEGALAQRRGQVSLGGPSKVGDEEDAQMKPSTPTALSDQIDQKLKMLREQRQRAVEEASAGL